MAITRETAAKLRMVLNEALKTVEAEMNCKATVGTIRFTNTEMGMKLTFISNNSEKASFLGDPLAEYEHNLKTMGYMYGLTEKDFGMKDPDTGAIFVGLLPKRKKYPFVFQSKTGKFILYPHSHFNLVKFHYAKKVTQ